MLPRLERFLVSFESVLSSARFNISDLQQSVFPIYMKIKVNKRFNGKSRELNESFSVTQDFRTELSGHFIESKSDGIGDEIEFIQTVRNVIRVYEIDS